MGGGSDPPSKKFNPLGGGGGGVLLGWRPPLEPRGTTPGDLLVKRTTLRNVRTRCERHIIDYIVCSDPLVWLCALGLALDGFGVPSITHIKRAESETERSIDFLKTTCSLHICETIPIRHECSTPLMPS
jgi:hypothetical protein